MEHEPRLSQGKINLMFSAVGISLVLAVVNAGVLTYFFISNQSSTLVTTGQSDSLSVESESAPIRNFGPTFAELNIDPPPPATNQTAYAEWAQAYGIAYLEYLGNDTAQVDGAPPVRNQNTYPETLEEEDWLEREIKERQIDMYSLNQEELEQMNIELLREFRSQ